MTLRRTESRRGVGGIPVISKDRRLKLRAMGSTQAEERREIHWFLCSVSLNRWIAYDGSSLERKKMKRESQMNYGPFSEGEGESEGEIGRRRRVGNSDLLLITSRPVSLGRSGRRLR